MASAPTFNPSTGYTFTPSNGLDPSKKQDPAMPSGTDGTTPITSTPIGPSDNPGTQDPTGPTATGNGSPTGGPTDIATLTGQAQQLLATAMSQNNPDDITQALSDIAHLQSEKDSPTLDQAASDAQQALSQTQNGGNLQNCQILNQAYALLSQYAAGGAKSPPTSPPSTSSSGGNSGTNNGDKSGSASGTSDTGTCNSDGSDNDQPSSLNADDPDDPYTCNGNIGGGGDAPQPDPMDDDLLGDMT